MKNFSFLSPLWMSFYSRDIYRDVVYRRRGAMMLYLLAVVVLTWIPATILTATFTSTFVKEELPKLVAQLPAFIEFKGGKLTTPEARPYFITYGGGTLMVIDSTAEGENAHPEIPFVFGKTQGISRTVITPDSGPTKLAVGDTKKRVVSWAGMDTRFTPEDVTKVGQAMIVIFPLGVFFVGAFFLYVWRTIQSFLFSIAGVVLSNILRKQLPYVPVLRLTVVAMTPALLLLSVLMFVRVIPDGVSTLLFGFIVLGYLYFGLTSLGPQHEEAAQASPPIAPRD